MRPSTRLAFLFLALVTLWIAYPAAAEHTRASAPDNAATSQSSHSPGAQASSAHLPHALRPPASADLIGMRRQARQELSQSATPKIAIRISSGWHVPRVPVAHQQLDKEPSRAQGDDWLQPPARAPPSVG